MVKFIKNKSTGTGPSSAIGIMRFLMRIQKSTTKPLLCNGNNNNYCSRNDCFTNDDVKQFKKTKRRKTKIINN